MKLKPTIKTVGSENSDVDCCVNPSLVERDLADVLVVEYECSGDRRFVAYLLNIDPDYCYRIAPVMFDPPDKQPSMRGRP